MGPYERKYSLFFIFPAVVYLIAFTVYPTFYTWFMSFSDYTLGKTKFVYLENYKFLLLHDKIFKTSLLYTLYYVFLVVILEFIFGFGIAILLNREFKGKSLALILIMIPMMIAPIVTALVFKILYDPTFGLLNYLIRLITGFQGQDWFTNAQLAKIAVMLIDVWQWTPFVALVLLAGFQYLPPEIFEAAKVDGASPLQLLRYVTLPMLKRIILLVLIFRSMDAFKAFEYIYATTKGGPGYATQTLNIYAYLSSFRYTKFGIGAAISIIMFSMIAILTVGLIRILRSEV